MIRHIHMEHFIIDKMDSKTTLLSVLKVKMSLGIFSSSWIVSANLKAKTEAHSTITGIVCPCKEEAFALSTRNHTLECSKWNAFRYTSLDASKIMLTFRCYAFCTESGQYMRDI